MKNNRRVVFVLLTGIIVLRGLVSCSGENKQETGSVYTLAVQDTIPESEKIISELNERIAADPDNPNLYHERSFVYLRLGEFDKAMNDVNRCIAIDSTVAGFYFTKAEILFAELKAEEAKEQYEIALQLQPDYWGAELKIGKMYMYLHNWNEAMKHINSALKIEPTIPEAYFMKGEVYEELGDSAKAASSFQTAIEQDPDYYDAYIRLGILYAGARNMLALEYYNSALDLRPESIEALYNKAMFCQENGMYQEALNTYDKILSINRNMEIVYHNKGYVYLVYLEQPEVAIEMLTKALQLNPQYVNAYHNRGLAYEAINEFQKARQDYKKALSIDPQFDLSANALDDLDRRGLH